MRPQKEHISINTIFARAFTWNLDDKRLIAIKNNTAIKK